MYTKEDKLFTINGFIMDDAIVKTDNNVPRNNGLDILKGIAIILVVLGHSIQFSSNDFDNNIFFRLIYLCICLCLCSLVDI